MDHEQHSRFLLQTPKYATLKGSDYKRVLTAMMSAENDRAISWLQRSIADDQSYVPAPDLLVSPQTAVLISQARSQTGDLKGATSFLEQQLKVQPPAADLYLELASSVTYVNATAYLFVCEQLHGELLLTPMCLEHVWRMMRSCSAA